MLVLASDTKQPQVACYGGMDPQIVINKSGYNAKMQPRLGLHILRSNLRRCIGNSAARAWPHSQAGIRD